MSATGKAETEADKKLLEAINDESITVKLNTTSNQLIDSKDGTTNIPLLPGAFEGSEVNEDGSVTATQIINIENAEKIGKETGEETGEILRHESNEAYIGAVQNPGGDYKSAYKSAHHAASQLDGKRQPELDVNRDNKRNMLQFRKKGNTKWIDLGPINNN